MTASDAQASFRSGPINARRFAQHPEWWVLASSVAAWLFLGASARHVLVQQLCTAPSSGLIDAINSTLRATEASSQLAWILFELTVMTVAMMLPLVMLPVRHVAFRSFSDRRHRAISGFLCGYLGLWILLGAALLPVVFVVSYLSPGECVFIGIIAYAAAAVWQLTPFKQEALQRCHRTVALAPEGWRADIACFRYGLGIGGSCVASCWALMTAAAFASHDVAVMACIQTVMVGERYQQRRTQRDLPSHLLLFSALVFYLHHHLGFFPH
jgi:predicted metal-binding membrane protein